VNGCGGVFGSVLMGIFVYISTILMMNIFIAVVVEAFGAENDEKRGIVPQDVLEEFFRNWRKVDDDLTLFVTVPELIEILKQTSAPIGVAVAGGHTLAKVSTIGDVTFDREQNENSLASNALRSIYANLTVSLCDGKAYFYDVLSEILRVLAVKKARSRGEQHGIFFQSRSAVSLLTQLDTDTFRSLKRKWYVASLLDMAKPV